MGLHAIEQKTLLTANWWYQLLYNSQSHLKKSTMF